MATVYQLLAQGYSLDVPQVHSNRIDFNSELYDYMYDPERKVITGVPLLSNYVPQNLTLQYIFDSGHIASVYNEFSSDVVLISPNIGVLDEDLIFQYADFAHSLRDLYGKLTEVILQINFSQKTTYRAHYYPCDPIAGRAEAYTGTEIYINDKLVSLSSMLLMYDIYDLNDLKKKIYALEEVKKEQA